MCWGLGAQGWVGLEPEDIRKGNRPNTGRRISCVFRALC